MKKKIVVASVVSIVMLLIAIICVFVFRKDSTPTEKRTKMEIFREAFEMNLPDDYTTSEMDGVITIQVPTCDSVIDLDTFLTLQEGYKVKFSKDKFGLMKADSKITNSERIYMLVTDGEDKVRFTLEFVFNNVYKVSFDLKGGAGTIEAQTFNSMKTDNYVAEPKEQPTKIGYTFAGWYYENKPFNFKSTAVSRSFTLEAEWEPIEVNFKVSKYYYQNGKFIQSGKTIVGRGFSGSTAILTPYETLAGYVLDKEELEKENLIINGDGSTVIHMKFRKAANYKVNIYHDGKLTDTKTVTSLEGKDITYSAEQKEGYFIDKSLSKLSGKVLLNGSLSLSVHYVSNYVKDVLTVNGKEIDMSSVIKYIDGDDKLVPGFYNYHLSNQTITNLCNAKMSITDSTHQVLYVNRVFKEAFSFEVTIDMSSLDKEKNSAYARQGIVLSDGTTELAIFPAKWTSGNLQNNTLKAGTGAWYVHNGKTGTIIADAGAHDGVGKCITTNYASTITLKVEKAGNTHINLYVNGKLVTVLKADGFYRADGTKSANKDFNKDLAALLSSKETVVGFNHFNALNFPHIVYKNIKCENIKYIIKKLDKVENSVKEIPLSELVTAYGGVTFEVYKGNTKLDKFVLAEGSNTFKIKFSDGTEEEISIYRNKLFTVNFMNYDNSVFETQKVEEGQTISAPATYPVDEVYGFTGWKFDFKKPITANKNIVATWVVKVPKTYQIQYFFDGSENEELREEIESYVEAPIVVQVPEKTGYYTTQTELTGVVKKDSDLVFKVNYVSSFVNNKITVNEQEMDMSDIVKFIDGDEEPVDGYYNYHVTNKTVTNLCNANRSITDDTRKVLYLNKVLTDSFIFETTIDMSSLDEKTNSAYARQGIVLSNGTVELAIFPAKWTSGSKQDNTIKSNTGAWYVHNGTTGAIITDAGTYDGVGKCVTTNYASSITLKLVKVGNSHISLYANDKLVTVLRADGIYNAKDGAKSTTTTFNNDLATLLASEEMVVGFNHYNALNFPNIVYSGMTFEEIKFEDRLVADKVTVNGKTFDMSSVLQCIDGDDKPVNGYYNYHLTKQTVTNLCNANRSITDGTRKVLYLNKVLTDSFIFETKIDMSSLDDKTNSAYARQGIVLSNGTVELAIFPAKWTSGNKQDNTIKSDTGVWYVHNGKTGTFVTDAGTYDGVGKCVTTNYASSITLKVVKVGNTHINLYANNKLITTLKADGFYNAKDGVKSTTTTFNNDLSALLSSEEMVVGFNHYNALNCPNIVYKGIEFESGLVSEKLTVNGKNIDMSNVIKYIDGNDTPIAGFYNYHMTDKTITNLCTADRSITYNANTRKVLYLNKILKGSFVFETTIDMSSLDDKTNSAYARQGIVLSDGTVELAIFPAKWTSGNKQDNTIKAGTGRWYVHNGTTGAFIDAEAGEHAGVGKCVSDKYSSRITLKVEKVGNTHINLYVNNELITILKPDGFYNGTSGEKSTKTTTDFNNDLAALFASEEMVIGFNHFSELTKPNIVYKGIKFGESLVSNQITVNGKIIDMSDVIRYIDGNDAPIEGYYNYHMSKKTVTNLCTANRSITYNNNTRRVLYLNKILTGSFTFETKIDMSSLDDKTNSAYARQGIVLSNGTVELAIFPAKWTSGNKQDNTIEAGTGRWYVHNGTTGAFIDAEAGEHAGVGKCVSEKYASSITLKVKKVGNTQINLYVNDELVTILKADGFYNGASGKKSTKTTTDFNQDLAALLSSEEMVIGFNHYSELTKPNIIYKKMKFE